MELKVRRVDSDHECKAQAKQSGSCNFESIDECLTLVHPMPWIDIAIWKARKKKHRGDCGQRQELYNIVVVIPC